MTEQSSELVRFAAVRIGCDDVARAARRYALLLGTEPVRSDDGAVRFALARGAVELVPGVPGAQALRLTRTARTGAAADEALAAARSGGFAGLDVTVDPAPASGATPPGALAPPLDGSSPTAGGFLAIDHVVVNTPDPERALALWRDTLGVRLALDREFPQRGLRMLFFRSAGVTLEIVSALGGAATGSGPDVLNGIAYRVADVARVRERLLAAGFDVSPVRTGNKAGTLVATVRSETEGVPTLLLSATAAPG